MIIYLPIADNAFSPVLSEYWLSAPSYVYYGKPSLSQNNMAIYKGALVVWPTRVNTPNTSGGTLAASSPSVA